MNLTIQMLYHSWVGGPRPDLWPESLAKNPVEAHGLYCFDQGLRLGIQLAAAAFFPEMEL